MSPTGGSFRASVVCSGNICRSPIGEYVLRQALADAGLEHQVLVDSAGIGGWHVGDGADRRSVQVLAQHGLDARGHRVQQITPAWFALDDQPDLLLAMDTSHYAALRRIAPDTPVHMYREFDPALEALPRGDIDLDVPDPYYGGRDGFDEVYAMIADATPGIVAHIRAQL